MNWLEILLITIASFGVVGGLSWWMQSKIWLEPIMSLLGMACFITSLTIIIGGICETEYHETTKYLESYELVSLENVMGTSGSFSGGGSFLGGSISGSMNSSSYCKFITKNADGEIKINTVDNDKVTFFSTDDGYTEVQKYAPSYYYPRRIKNDFYSWNSNRVEWRIWIPEDKINNYIKFN